MFWVIIRKKCIFQPFEVFAEVHRILKDGGSFVVSFSNRMFPTKAIKAWRMSDDVGHIYIATYYFQESADWKLVTVSDVTNESVSGHTDPLYIIHGIK